MAEPQQLAFALDAQSETERIEPAIDVEPQRKRAPLRTSETRKCGALMRPDRILGVPVGSYWSAGRKIYQVRCPVCRACIGTRSPDSTYCPGRLPRDP